MDIKKKKLFPHPASIPSISTMTEGSKRKLRTEKGIVIKPFQNDPFENLPLPAIRRISTRPEISVKQLGILQSISSPFDRDADTKTLKLKELQEKKELEARGYLSDIIRSSIIDPKKVKQFEKTKRASGYIQQIMDKPSYKKGGMVKKTGDAILHKGEVVVPTHRVETVKKAMKKNGLKPISK